MGLTKKINYINPLYLPLYLFILLIPLGQIVRINLSLSDYRIVLQPVDIVALSTLIYILITKPKFPKVVRYIKAFLLTSVFSLILSLGLFGFKGVIVGSLYFLRLVAYFGFFVYLWNIFRNARLKLLVFELLIAASLVMAILGWVQYFLFPDLRTLKYFGWDDHLYRLVGTYLDPGFTGIVLVLGILVVVTKYLSDRKKYLIFITGFLLITIAFTYSRASYLSLAFGLVVIAFLYKLKFKLLLLIGIIFAGIIISLPRPSSEGVKLERINSIVARWGNYIETTKIIKKSPLFGVGFNNLCIAKIKYLNTDNLLSHSCYGSDSDILMLIATTGIVGFFIFLYMLYKLFSGIGSDMYSICLSATGVSILINSLFINSMFYPFVMGWFAVLAALSVKDNN